MSVQHFGKQFAMKYFLKAVKRGVSLHGLGGVNTASAGAFDNSVAGRSNERVLLCVFAASAFSCQKQKPKKN